MAERVPRWSWKKGTLHPASIIGKGFMAVRDLPPGCAPASSLQKTSAVDVLGSAAEWPPDGCQHIDTLLSLPTIATRLSARVS